jgi:hypothetical protein
MVQKINKSFLMVPKEESTSFIGWIEGAKFTDIDPTLYAAQPD